MQLRFKTKVGYFKTHVLSSKAQDFQLRVCDQTSVMVKTKRRDEGTDKRSIQNPEWCSLTQRNPER